MVPRTRKPVAFAAPRLTSHPDRCRPRSAAEAVAVTTARTSRPRTSAMTAAPRTMRASTVWRSSASLKTGGAVPALATRKRGMRISGTRARGGPRRTTFVALRERVPCAPLLGATRHEKTSRRGTRLLRRPPRLRADRAEARTRRISRLALRAQRRRVRAAREGEDQGQGGGDGLRLEPARRRHRDDAEGEARHPRHD